MRILRRLARILLFTVMICLGLIALALLATQTPWFKDWLRRYIVRESAQVLNGELTIGRLSGSLFFGIAMSDVTLTQQGEKIIAIKDLHVDYSVFELISRGIAINEIELNQLVVIAKKEKEGWNVSRLVKREQQEGKRRGPGRPITIARILLHDGFVGVDKGDGSPREEISRLDADFGFVYAPVRFTIDIGRLGLHSSHPALTLSQLSGSVTVANDDIHINRLAIRLPETDLRVDGMVRTYSKNAQFALDVASSKMSFTEIAALVPALHIMKVQPAFTLKISGPLSRLQTKLDLKSRDGGNVNGTVFTDVTAHPLRFDGDVEAHQVNLAPWIDNPRFAGAITGRARFDMRLPDSSRNKPISGTYHFTGPSATTAGYAGQDIDARGTFAGAKVIIAQGSAKGYGAFVTTTNGLVDGTVPGHKVIYRFQGRASHADLRQMPKQLSPPPLATDLDVDYNLQGEGTSVKADVLFHPSEVEGSHVAEGTRGNIAYDGTHLSYAADGTVTNLDLQRIGRALNIQTLTQERFRGGVGGDFHVEATGKNLSEMVLTASGTLRNSTLFGAQFPQVTFETHFNHAAFDATAKGSFASLDPSHVIENDSYKAMLTGTMDGRVEIPDLRESFSFETFRFDGQAHFQNSQFRGITMATAMFDGAVEKSAITARQFTFDGPELSGSVSGTFVFTDREPSKLTYQITAPDLKQFAARTNQPIAGVATAQGTLTGLYSDLSTTGTAQVQELKYGENVDVTKGRASYTVRLPAPIQDLARVKVEAQVDTDTIKAYGHDINTVSTHVTYADRQANFDGRVHEGPRATNAAGRVLLLDGAQEVHLPKLSISANGVTWETNPQASGEAVLKYDSKTVAIANLDLTHGPQHVVANGTVAVAEGATSNLKVEAQQVDLAQVELLAGSTDQRFGGALTANATIAGTFAQPTGDVQFSIAQGAFQRVQFQAFAGHAALGGRRVTLDVKLDQSAGAALTAKGALPVSLFVNGESPGAAADEPVNLEVHSTPINLGLIEGATDVIHTVSGTAQIDVTVTNTVKNPKVDGTMKLIDGAFTVAPTGSPYHAINGTVRFTPAEIIIDSFNAQDDEGDPLEARGVLTMGPRWGTVGQLRLDVNAQRFEVLDNRFGVADVNAKLQIQGDPRRPQISGDVDLHTGRIEVDQVLSALSGGPYSTEAASEASATQNVLAEAPVLPSPTAAPAPAAPAVSTTGQTAQQVQARQQQQQQTAGAKAPIGLYQGMDLDLRVKFPDDLILRGRDLKIGSSSIGLGNINLTVGGDLRLLKKPTTPVAIVGTVNTIRGSYDFYGRRFDIQRDGRIAFTGGSPPNPTLDVQATRLIQPSGIEARIRVEGTARRPRLSFSSNPPLDESDVLALIIFNQPLNNLESGQQSSLAALAGTTAAGFVVAPLTQSISRALNLDILEISTTTDPAGGTGGLLTVGQQIGESLFFRFQQQFGSQEYSEVIVEYQIARFLRLRATTAQGEGLGAANRYLTRRVERAGMDLIFYFSY